MTTMAAKNGSEQLAVNFDAIPAELKERPQWVLWKKETRGGKPSKVPYQPNGKRASTTKPETWLKYDLAVLFYKMKPDRYAGIGYVFSADDPFCGIDLDLCLVPESGFLAKWAQEVLGRVPGYAEVSPSGSGVKLICRGGFPIPNGGTGTVFVGMPSSASIKGKSAEIAVWNERRYFTFTGNTYNGNSTIPKKDCRSECENLYADCERKWKPEAIKEAKHQTAKPSTNGRKPRPADDKAVADCLGKVLKIQPKFTENDGSKRLLAWCCRCVEFNLDDTQAIMVVRKAEKVLPFPAARSDDDIIKRIRSAEEKATRGKALVQEGEKTISRPLTDYGNAERFVSQHSSNVRFCHEWGKWLVWDGRRWAIDKTGAIERLAKKTVRKIYIEASNSDLDDDEVKAIVRWARASENTARLQAMLTMAKSESGIPIGVDQLDAQAWLLNCENGTIDLKTGKASGRREFTCREPWLV